MRKDVGVRRVLHGGRGDRQAYYRYYNCRGNKGVRLTLHNVALLKYFVGITMQFVLLLQHYVPSETKTAVQWTRNALRGGVHKLFTYMHFEVCSVTS